MTTVTDNRMTAGPANSCRGWVILPTRMLGSLQKLKVNWRNRLRTSIPTLTFSVVPSTGYAEVVI
jgi:hypothetical protein